MFRVIYIYISDLEKMRQDYLSTHVHTLRGNTPYGHFTTYMFPKLPAKGERNPTQSRVAFLLGIEGRAEE